MMNDEQRNAPRFAVHCRAALVERKSRRRVPVYIYDLSETGAAVSSHNFIVDEGEYELEFTVPGDGKQELRTPCHVARIMLSPDLNDFCAGLRFSVENLEASPALQKFLAKLGSHAVH